MVLNSEVKLQVEYFRLNVTSGWQTFSFCVWQHHYCI